MIKNILFLTLLLINTCGLFAQTTITDSFRFNGVFRSYRFRIPALMTQTTRPLVINLHGLGSNMVEQQIYSNFDPIADTAGFYLVMPQGTTNNSGIAFWDVGFPGSPAIDDIGFISALIDTLVARYPIDAAQVYATGLSNGGYLSHLLALQLSDKIAAVASVAGTIVNSKYASLSPRRAMPVMEIHGDADPTVPYGGFAYGIAIDTLMAAWVRWDGCNTTPVMTAVPNTNISDGSTAEKYVWTGGQNRTEVVLFRIRGGGHTWPGASFIIGSTNQDVSASLEIWRFFRRWRLGGATGASGFMINEKQPWFSPNPVKDFLHILKAGKGTTSVFDFSGKCLLQSASPEISLQGLPTGTYLLKWENGADKRSAFFVKE